MTRAFFTPRAVGWEKKFPDDLPLYRAAVELLGLGDGDTALDAGCGTGRAVPLLREAVGPRGTVLGMDLTPAMLREAVRLGRAGRGGAGGASFLVADCLRLPLRDGVLRAVFAAGLLPHVPEPRQALRELARVTGEGGRLALFHPVGRAVLAKRHGRELGPDDLLAEPNLRPALEASGWRLTRYEDEEARFLVIAVREPLSGRR
ncbi:class I SAM-dependent methyltransferase [Wenjunlia tyrosinilytica]|nr:methyltransferase domain-containing protein [Wenjunlia tyrosinilytica]